MVHKNFVDNTQGNQQYTLLVSGKGETSNEVCPEEFKSTHSLRKEKKLRNELHGEDVVIPKLYVFVGQVPAQHAAAR